MIHLYKGYGKGKTTAATGLALRAAGQQLRVLFLQFLKGNPTGEVELLETLPGIQVKRLSRNYGFVSQMTEEEKAAVRAEHEELIRYAGQQLERQVVDMVVLDEIGSALELDMTAREPVERLLEEYGQKAEIVMTAHGDIGWLEEYSDYCTEMRKIRHPYDRGVAARKGIEY